MRKRKPKNIIAKKNNKVLVSLVLILAAFLITVVFKYNKNSESDAEKITETLLLPGGKVIDGQKLEQINKMDYSDIKKSLNARDDFCLYMEDESGNVVLAKGASSLSRDGLKCK